MKENRVEFVLDLIPMEMSGDARVVLTKLKSEFQPQLDDWRQVQLKREDWGAVEIRVMGSLPMITSIPQMSNVMSRARQLETYVRILNTLQKSLSSDGVGETFPQQANSGKEELNMTAT